jgi:glycosyltransferase involved in cell wall biosynthesis
MFVGRILGDKGIREFVGASENVRACYPQVRCQILGSIDIGNPTAIPKQELEEWIKRGIVEYLGSTEDVRPHIKNSDCVVLPSYREGTSRVLLEACAMGRPVIATNTPGCSGVVVDRKTGLLCKVRDSQDLAEKMVTMINMSKEERVVMGLSGRKYIESKFDEKVVIRHYITAIDQCV